jgi:hypothetical protein
MAAFDIFNNDAFSLFSMTDAIERIPHRPGLLGSMNLFTPVPVTTVTVAVERLTNSLSIIQTSERGAPPSTQNKIRPDIRDFRTVRLYKQDTLYSHEIQNVRAFGTESELQTMVGVVARRQQRLLNDLMLTRERHMLGAINGIVLDADGSTIRNYFTEFGISQPGEITFSNAAVTAAGGMRPFLAKNIVRPMMRALGQEMPGVQIVCLAGDDFYDYVTEHPDVKATFINWNAASDLREAVAFAEFNFGGVAFVNYRGTDDNTTVAVAPTKSRFFLRGVPDLFQSAYSPGESFELANTPGRNMYSMVLPDTKRQSFVEIEVASYPLDICTRPETLLRGTL